MRPKAVTEAGRIPGQRAGGADSREGRPEARDRRGGDPPDQRARGQGPVRRAQRARAADYATSAFLKQALDKGADLFKWEERKARSGQRSGSKVRGVGVAVSAYSAGSMGFDGLPDPETPVGARGVGEAPVGAGFGAVVNAIAAAVGDEIFRRAPVTADKILMAIEAGRPMHEALTANVTPSVG